METNLSRVIYGRNMVPQFENKPTEASPIKDVASLATLTLKIDLLVLR